MALKTVPSRLRRGEAGLTLLELLTAISLTALIAGMAFHLLQSVGSAVFRLEEKRQSSKDLHLLLSSLGHSVQEGKGIREAGEEVLLWEDAAGGTHRLSFGDSTVTVDGNPWPLRIGAFEMRFSGGGTRTDEIGSPPPAEVENLYLDSLDADGDRLLSLTEMDADRNGKVSEWEARLVDFVEIRVAARGRKGDSAEARLGVFPRNRLIDFAIY